MGWSREFIERVREATDLTDVARDYGAIKSGSSTKVSCPDPRHSDNDPSCSVQSKYFNCFSCGDAKGDCFKFIELIENVEFNEAVDHLTRRAGIASSYPNPPDWVGGRDSGDDRRKDLFYAVSQAVEIFHLRLLDMKNKPAQQARKFLRSRRIEGDQAKKYMIGYSYPKSKGHADSLIRELKPRMTEYFKEELDKSDSEFDQWFEKTLIEAGLAKEYEGQLSDFFFDERIMFPIFDISDRPIAFSGRQLPGGRDPKYRNSPNSKIYAKEETLYGLNWAKKNLTNNNSTIVSEGCLDVIALHECGLPTAVAPCGTSMTEKQVKKLAKYTKNFSLCFDSDSAGQKATERFTQWEEEHSLNLIVVNLPSGEDPGDFHSNNRCDDLVSLTENTTRFLKWRIDRVWALADPDDIEGRSMAAEDMLQIVKDHHNEMIQDDYVQQIAEITGLSYGHLVEKFNEMEKTPERKAPLPPPQEPPDDDYRRAFDQPPPDLHENPRRETKEPRKSQNNENLDSAECRVLSLMLHNQETLRNLKLSPERITEQFFYEDIHRKIYNVLQRSSTVEDAKTQLGNDENAVNLLSKMHIEGPLQGIDETKASATVAELLYRTAKHHYDEKHNNATKNSDIEVVKDLGPAHNHLTWLMDSLDPFSESADYLIAWISSIHPEKS